MESIEKVIELYERVKKLDIAIEKIIQVSADTCIKCSCCSEINRIACEVRER